MIVFVTIVVADVVGKKDAVAAVPVFLAVKTVLYMCAWSTVAVKPAIVAIGAHAILKRLVGKIVNPI